MAKEITTGVQQIAAHLKESQDDLRLKAWRDLRNKIDSLLLSTNVMKSNEVKQSCLALDTMNDSERRDYIAKSWGPAYLSKVDPLLHQLATLERNMAGPKSEANPEKPQD